MPSGDRPAPGSTPGLEREIEAWLETIGVDSADTMRSTTIVPTGVRHSTGGQRALALLQDLAGQKPGATAHLRQGEIIGEGGMGVIRLAEQVALGRTVAVKTLKAGRRDPGSALDLLREAWVTGSIEHPNVVPVHYLGLDDDGSPLIVLKRIEGVEWTVLMDDAEAVRERFGATDLLAWNLGILMQVLNAVRFAHTRGIVHRDLKPSNVMIGEFGEVYLLDWGIAVSLRDDGSGRLPLAANATEMAGTPCYMAPEMLGREGSAPLSERTDVYLAGALLYDVVAGHPPHQGTTAVAVITSVMASNPPMPPEMPAELGRICSRAMRADPADRYPSAEELQQALQQYLEHRGSARLADRAQQRLDELLAMLASKPRGEREEVYRLFGACRFGFHEALVAWRDNDDARAGLVRATVAVAEYEVAGDDPRAAVSLLSELDAPPAELLVRARAAVAAHAVRQAELEHLRSQHDPTIGTRTRSFLAMVLGFMFTLFPLLGAVFPQYGLETHVEQTLWSLGFLTLFVALGYWARESLSKTAINRRVLATGVLLFVAQAILTLGTWSLGVSVVHTQVIMLFLWMVLTAMLAIAVDWRLAPAAIGYAIGFGIAAKWPDSRLFVMSATNLLFAINAVWHWKPQNFRWTDDERLARGLPPRRS